MRRKLPAFSVIMLLFVTVFVVAMTAGANVGEFSMSPILPENQNPEVRGFFDLRVEAGTRQEISVAVTNSSDEPIDVSLTLVTASTSRGGQVNYSTPGINDETMAHSLSEIAQIAPGGELVTILPGEAAIVPITIDIPSEGFDGIILGSVRALLEITEEQRAEAGLIVNRFAHVLVIRLQERDTQVEPRFELGDVRADLVNHRASIVAELRNTQPRLTMGALVHAQIYHVGTNEPIFSSSNVSVDFAPNTIFHFSMIDQAGFGLEPGDYFARIQVQHGEANWDFERDFEILPQQAQEINTAAVNIQQQQPLLGDLDILGFSLSNDLLLLGGIGLLILAALIVLIIVIATRKNKSAKKSEPLDLTDEELKRQLELLGVKTNLGSESAGNVNEAKDKIKANNEIKAIDKNSDKDSESQHNKKDMKIKVRLKKEK